MYSTSNIAEPQSSPKFLRHELCGVPVDELSLEQLLQAFVELSEPSRETSLVCYLNAHVHNLARRDAGLRRILKRATIVYPDGASIVWGCRHHGWLLPGRLTAADFLTQLVRRLQERERRIYFLGGKPGVAERCAEQLQIAVPGFRASGCYHGYFSDGESSKVIDQIRASAADVLAVGMGAPRQEKWVRDHWSELSIPLIWTVGALFDFAAGDERRCPKWMGDHGLEWLHRLWRHPRRMAARYLLGNPAYVWAVLRSRGPTRDRT